MYNYKAIFVASKDKRAEIFSERTDSSAIDEANILCGNDEKLSELWLLDSHYCNVHNII